MAAYLLFGFVIAGLLHWLIRRDLVQRWLGKPGIGGVIKAALVGVPMPLCSCSVIPVAASLRKNGASRGATASFLSSTPQTGVDSILATYALLGGFFTAVRVLVAFICGLISGLLVDLFCKEKAASTASPTLNTGLSLSPVQQPQTLSGLAPLTPPPVAPSPPQRTWRDGMRHGLITLPADLAIALLSGLLLAGLITTLIPENWLSGALGSGLTAFIVATLISLPLYVCATASIPMAYALMAAGLSPGATLVFLIVGPATNTATVVTVWGMLGRKATAIYIGSLVAVSWIAGWGFNQLLTSNTMSSAGHHHAAHQLALWQHGSGIALLMLIAFAYWKSKAPQKTKSCCSA